MDKNAIIKALRDYTQATSNEVANTVTLPIDLINKGLGYIGLGSNEPVGGSEWMRRQGLTAPVPEGTAQLLGETTGLVMPMVAAAKATQIATALRNMGENIAKPKGGGMAGGQRGALLYDSNGKTRQQMADIIQRDADTLVDMLKAKGYAASVEHSGSKMGPSSYVGVLNPITEKNISNIRLSDHSKGPFNHAGLYGNFTAEEFPQLIQKIERDLTGPKSIVLEKDELTYRMAQELMEQGKKSSSAWKAARRQANEFYETQHLFPRPLAQLPTPPQNLVKALRDGN